jgi:hypothetical protein
MASKLICMSGKPHFYQFLQMIRFMRILNSRIRMVKKIRLLYTFYKSFWLLSIFITTICLRIFWTYGFASFSGIFWCKLLTLALTYYFINDNKKKEYYYYQNLGVSKTLLWTGTISFDFILFLCLLILTHYLK